MKKIHIPTLKFHTIFTVVIALIFTSIIVFVRDIALSVAMVLILLYVAGNGVIHTRNNQLSRDAFIEYVIISVIVLVVVIGAVV